jgi:predicted PurR-regulated permease PerM
VDAAQRAAQPTPPDPEEVVEAGLTIAEIVVTAASLLALVFFWLLEHSRLRRYGLAFVPPERRSGVRASWVRIERRLGSWVRGQLILMATMATATTIAYVVLGLPAAILLGLIAGLFEAIPMVGPLLGAIPAIAVAATVSPELAIIVSIIYLALQIIEGYVLIPLVMRNTIGLSPFIVLVSLLTGAAVGGLAGAFLAVPVAATIESVIENFQVRAVPVRSEPGAGPRVKQPAKARAPAATPPSTAPDGVRSDS